MEHADQNATIRNRAAPGRSATPPVRFGPSPFKGLVVKSEYLLQSVLTYPFAVSCPHCRSPRHALVARKYRVARIVRCRDCGLYFSRPIYRSWLAENFYDGLYTAGFGTILPDEVHLERWLTTGFRDTRREADTVLEKIRLHAPTPSASLLEIGCSWGYFLHQARAAGFTATGVEIGAKRRDFGRQRLGLDIVGDLSDLPAGQQYDVIYTSHVLEHFTDLHGVFPRLASALKDDGVLFIEVPNFDPQQFGSRCFPVVGAVHPLGFNSEFFRANLPRHGLAITGIYGRWEDVPDRPVPVPPTDVFIVRAARARASDGPRAD